MKERGEVMAAETNSNRQRASPNFKETEDIRDIVARQWSQHIKPGAKYHNWGLGLMTERQRESLRRMGKIVTVGSEDYIATRLESVLEYSERGSEVIKREREPVLDTLSGKAILELREHALRQRNCKILRADIAEVPLWDGELPNL